MKFDVYHERLSNFKAIQTERQRKTKKDRRESRWTSGGGPKSRRQVEVKTATPFGEIIRKRETLVCIKKTVMRHKRG